MSQGIFPDLPRGTEQAAKSIFNRKNPYLAVGDEIEAIGARVNLSNLTLENEKATISQALLALITVFQHAEYLTDRQAADAARLRLDWKYALHLSEAFPGFDPAMLCKFRYRIYTEPEGQQVLQDLYREVGKDGLTKLNGSETKAKEILYGVCRANQLEWLVEGMALALESLASHYPKWLLGVIRPYWYRRYRYDSGQISSPDPSTDQKEWAKMIGKDVGYLLEAARESGDAQLVSLPELKALEQLYREQFEHSNSQVVWQQPDCLVCKQNMKQEISES